MSDPERHETVKRFSPKVKKPEAHRSDIQPTKKTLARTIPGAHLSTVGKEGEGVKHGLANLFRFKDALGTEDRDAGVLLLSQAVLAMPRFGTNGNPQEYVASAMAILRSIGPRDNLEGVLAVQMTAVHNLAMEFMAQASRSDGNLEVVEANVNRANKLLRTFAAQMEALNASPRKHQSGDGSWQRKCQ